jgi:hypothetical protein
MATEVRVLLDELRGQLGPVAIVGPDGVVDLPSASQRRLLAALALHAPQPVRTEWLAWVLGVSNGALRKIVTRLRTGIGPDAIVTTATGYRLTLPRRRRLRSTSSSGPAAIRRRSDVRSIGGSDLRSRSSGPSCGRPARPVGWPRSVRRRSRTSPRR